MKLVCADLFCGAGGTSTGILQAGEELGYQMDLLAVNHWPTAVNSHSVNHPRVRHLCETLENINPARVVPGGRLDLLAASPECTGHSLGAAGHQRCDQSRATAWHICRWASDLRVNNLLIENVGQFQNWGPLGANRKPLKSRKGETFRAFMNTLCSLGFTPEYRILDAANFGDATHRRRLIILARRGKRIVWPDPSHCKNGDPLGLKPYRTARQIIDWSIAGKSIFSRKKPLAPNTVRKIISGLNEFGGISAEPFILLMENKGEKRSIDRPIPTITTARGGTMAVVQPFVIKYYGTGGAKSIDEPLDTVTTVDRFMLVMPRTGKVIAEMDILFRMLQPHEYAAAMSFPKNYQFIGTRRDQVKQIGNAVPVNLARACAHALLMN